MYPTPLFPTVGLSIDFSSIYPAPLLPTAGLSIDSSGMYPTPLFPTVGLSIDSSGMYPTPLFPTVGLSIDSSDIWLAPLFPTTGKTFRVFASVFPTTGCWPANCVTVVSPILLFVVLRKRFPGSPWSWMLRCCRVIINTLLFVHRKVCSGQFSGSVAGSTSNKAMHHKFVSCSSWPCPEPVCPK